MLDDETLRILGLDTSITAPELQLNSSLANNWQKWIEGGLKREEQAEVLAKYSRKGNCHLEAPKINPEVIASLFESAIKRDKYLMNAQNIRGSALAALGTGITLLLSPKEEGIDEYQLLECLADAGRLLTCAHRLDTITRKALITPYIDKKMKSMLDETKPDVFLFGENLAERIKSSKLIEKAGLELKSQPTVANLSMRAPTMGNWRGPPAKLNQGRPQVGNNQSYRKLTKFQPRGESSRDHQRDWRRTYNQSRGLSRRNTLQRKR